jgi:hypothetical protein
MVRTALADRARLMASRQNSWASISSRVVLASASSAPAGTSPRPAARRMTGSAAE